MVANRLALVPVGSWLSRTSDATPSRRSTTQPMRSTLGVVADDEALGDLEAPVVHPEAGHEVEGHAGFEDRLVGGPERDGALAPVGRVADADRVAAAALLVDAVPLHGPVEGVGDVAGPVAGPGGVEAGLEPLQQRLLGLDHGGRWGAEVHGPAQRQLVAAVGAGDLEEGAGAGLERLVVPGEVRGGGVGAGGEHRHEGGVVAAELVGAAHGGVVDGADQVALAHARLNELADPVVHALHDAGGPAHVDEFLLGLDAPLPVDQPGGVDDGGIRQGGDQVLVGGRRVVVVVELDADPATAETEVAQQPAQLAEGVPLGIHDVVVGVVEDARLVEVDGATGAVGVHAPAPPPRLAVGADDDRLGRVEGPAVVAGQPRHVGRVGGDQHVDAGGLHGGPHPGEADGVLMAAEREFHVGHRHNVVAGESARPCPGAVVGRNDGPRPEPIACGRWRS